MHMSVFKVIFPSLKRLHSAVIPVLQSDTALFMGRRNNIPERQVGASGQQEIDGSDS